LWLTNDAFERYIHPVWCVQTSQTFYTYAFLFLKAVDAITQLDIWTSDGKLVKTAPLGGEKTYATETSRLTVTPDVATDHFFLALCDEAGASNTFYFKATTADCKSCG